MKGLWSILVSACQECWHTKAQVGTGEVYGQKYIFVSLKTQMTASVEPPHPPSSSSAKITGQELWETRQLRQSCDLVKDLRV